MIQFGDEYTSSMIKDAEVQRTNEQTNAVSFVEERNTSIKLFSRIRFISICLQLYVILFNCQVGLPTTHHL